MTNRDIKQKLRSKLDKLMKPSHHTAEIAARSGYSIRYVYHWWQSNLIHPTIEQHALNLLSDLRHELIEKADLIEQSK